MRKGTRNLNRRGTKIVFIAVSLSGSGIEPLAAGFATATADVCGEGETIACDPEPSLQHAPRTTGRVVSQQACPLAMGTLRQAGSHGAHPPMIVASIRIAAQARTI
jgi:hypothetical protein